MLYRCLVFYRKLMPLKKKSAKRKEPNQIAFGIVSTVFIHYVVTCMR